MSRCGRRAGWRGFARRLTACLALFAYLLTALGGPLPVVRAKDHTQPFPCQDHPCGCLTADACWRHCCCFGPEEKLAWARAHNIEPPSYAELPSRSGWNAPRLGDANRGSCDCRHCATPVHKPGTSESKSRCAADREPAGCCSAKHTKDSSRQSPSRLRWTLGVDVLRCHGQSNLWVSFGAVSPPPPALNWQPSWQLAGKLVILDLSPPIVALAPPKPPPRLPLA
jgi:hypothetical protein